MAPLKTVVVSAALLVMGSLVASAQPAAAAPACQSGGWSTVAGGYRVSLYCSGSGFTNGFGSTRAEAAAEAQALADLYSTTGVDCTGSSVGSVTGGRSARLYCSGAGYIEDYGTTLSDAASEVRALAVLYARSGRVCDGQSTADTIRGYQVRLYCSDIGFVEGLGDTVTEAARAARAEVMS